MEVSVYAGGVGLVHLDDRQELLAGHQHLVLVVDDARQIHAPGGSRKNNTFIYRLYDSILYYTSPFSLTSNQPNSLELES